MNPVNSKPTHVPPSSSWYMTGIWQFEGLQMQIKFPGGREEWVGLELVEWLK